MAKIMSVDYEAMPRQAAQMRTHGQELNTEIASAYKSIADMHNSWYGQRYNSLVQEFNRMIPNLNELLQLVVGEIPFAVETIANNYSQADKGTNAGSATNTAPKKITNLTESKDVGMKFVTSEVTSVQTNISKNFTKAKDLMTTIESDYGKINWQSEASDAFKSKFAKLKSEIIKAFDEINSQFTKLMNQTKEDVQATESANTIK